MGKTVKQQAAAKVVSFAISLPKGSKELVLDARVVQELLQSKCNLQIKGFSVETTEGDGATFTLEFESLQL